MRSITIASGIVGDHLKPHATEKEIEKAGENEKGTGVAIENDVAVEVKTVTMTGSIVGDMKILEGTGILTGEDGNTIEIEETEIELIEEIKKGTEAADTTISILQLTDGFVFS